MIIDNIHHQLHTPFVDLFRKMLQILSCSIFRIYAPVIGNGVRAAERFFPVFLSNGIDRHQPDDICPQVFNSVKIFLYSRKCTFL